MVHAKAAERDARYNASRVKIAIIDTGVANDMFIKSEKGWYKDFVDGDDDMRRDGPGHGTTTVKLIFKALEDPLIYVARAFRDAEADNCTASLVAKVR